MGEIPTKHQDRMSHSADTVSSRRLHPVERAERVPEWETYVGITGFFYIVGPGPKAMKRVARERNLIVIGIANRAVALLNRKHRENMDAGPAEIMEALIACGWEDEF